ncbi:hypothetical protein [Oceanicaulis sp. MMSF_3324]|uniref:hypothetical protein n=1 Tax=Oceanicaulis sp. MMSF_3324 TaxID=3046702 RepID=UPI00273E0828|nr:hypothetical protein [Oceanicaulis sp. MMSF_3324]
MQAQRKIDMTAMSAPAPAPEDEARVAPPPFPTAPAGEASAIPSPAHALQERLESAFADPVVENRWSPRQTLALLVFTCGAFWGAVVGGAIHFLG